MRQHATQICGGRTFNRCAEGTPSAKTKADLGSMCSRTVKKPECLGQREKGQGRGVDVGEVEGRDVCNDLALTLRWEGR